MGFSISWLAVEGLAKAAVLDRLSLHDTEEIDPVNESSFSVATGLAGWVLVFSNDVAYAGVPERLVTLSVGGRVVACQVEEHCMACAAYLYEDGVQIFALEHISEKGIRDLSVIGRPPSEFVSIRDRLVQQQEKEDAENRASLLYTDFIFDIPLETARAICGYRHDRWKFDWGEPVFTSAQQRK